MNMQALEEPRIDFPNEGLGAAGAMMKLEQYVGSTGLSPTLLGLIKTRASQLNGCAFCIDMHTREARAHGESEERLYMLNAWRESPLYTDRERAALAWTEAITNIQDGHASDAVYNVVRPYFAGDALANLTLAIIAINGWNRASIGFRLVPGSLARIEAA